jgi:hypothetical protein
VIDLDGDNEEEDFMLQDTLKMEEVQHWYVTRLSPNLTKKRKESLFRRIDEYRQRHRPLPYANPVSEFPEIEKYWGGDSLTGLEIVVIAMELYRELRGPGKK